MRRGGRSLKKRMEEVTDIQIKGMNGCEKAV